MRTPSILQSPSSYDFYLRGQFLHKYIKVGRKNWVVEAKTVKERPFSGDTNQIKVLGSYMDGRKYAFLIKTTVYSELKSFEYINAIAMKF